MDAKQILEREFLQIRAKVLEIAAALDRLDRADGNLHEEPRAALISQAIEILAGESDNANRAERVQLLFSCDYDENWFEQYDVASRQPS